MTFPAFFSATGLMVPMMNESVSPAGFPTTRWSQVAHAVNPAAPEARAALAELCEAYWYPIDAFIRRKGNGPEQALDLTQGISPACSTVGLSQRPTRRAAASARS